MPKTVLTPPELARRWRMKADGVRRLLESGLLTGFNVADPDATRPRWRVTLDAVLAYEAGERPGAGERPEAGERPDPTAPRRRRRKRQSVPEGPF